MPRVQRTVRLSQSVVPFGVGAIYDVFGESFAACDTAMWGLRGRPIASSALRQQLGVDQLRSAPSVEERAGIPYIRFPGWLFCQRCRTLFRWLTANERLDEPAVCISCNGFRQLVPMRFVVACSNGHLSDVPWNIWAHSGSRSGPVRCDNQVLRFTGLTAGGSGLASLQVSCKSCNTKRSLAGLTAKDSLTKLGLNCLGTQPWQSRNQAHQCDADPQVIQRGASNVYFADVASALEIPTAAGFGQFESTRNAVESHPAFAMLRYMLEQGGVNALEGVMAQNLMETIEADLKVAKSQIRSFLLGDGDGPAEGNHIKREWIALTTPQPTDIDPASYFLTRHTSLLDGPIADAWVSAVADAVEHVVLVTRLKEVRALRSFSRLDPGNPQLRPDLTRVGIDAPKIKWVPAVEVFGEGIFLSFYEDSIRAWESKPTVRSRVAKLQANLRNSKLGQSIVKQRLGHDAVSARFVFLHTLAHLLIRELCFECGYSSASLRERIYSSSEPGESQAGILIFTAAGDSEGTLGGLVRQGQSPRLLQAIAKALDSALWCGADPICRESDGQGYDHTNLAACHACSLLPETSCVTGNMLLDRSLLAHDGADRSMSFFPTRSDPVVGGCQ